MPLYLRKLPLAGKFKRTLDKSPMPELPLTTPDDAFKTPLKDPIFKLPVITFVKFTPPVQPIPPPNDCNI